jgi:hypothetical protein
MPQRYQRRQTALMRTPFTLFATKPAHPHLDNDSQGRIDELRRLFFADGLRDCDGGDP